MTIAPLTDPMAAPCAVRLYEALCGAYGRRILTGQHTKTMEQAELSYIQSVTGKLPAVCGFELLGYSRNINWLDAEDHCLDEVRENMGTVDRALQWGMRGGIVTMTWHWFSPVGGRDKAFYTEFTDFDLGTALTEGTPAYEALLGDMDVIAGQFLRLQAAGIPILWRPLHEADGGWFWWGAAGAEAYKRLWHLMRDRFANYHGLHNLIWVSNILGPDWYPGDDSVDIISTDFYAPRHDADVMKPLFDKVAALSPNKMVALTESGPLLDPEKALREGAPWLWYMTWGEEFCIGQEWTTDDTLRAMYDSVATETLDSCIGCDFYGV